MDYDLTIDMGNRNNWAVNASARSVPDSFFLKKRGTLPAPPLQSVTQGRKRVNAISGPDFVRQDDNPCGAPAPAWRHAAGATRSSRHPPHPMHGADEAMIVGLA